MGQFFKLWPLYINILYWCIVVRVKSKICSVITTLHVTMWVSDIITAGVVWHTFIATAAPAVCVAEAVYMRLAVFRWAGQPDCMLTVWVFCSLMAWRGWHFLQRLMSLHVDTCNTSCLDTSYSYFGLKRHQHCWYSWDFCGGDCFLKSLCFCSTNSC